MGIFDGNDEDKLTSLTDEQVQENVNLSVALWRAFHTAIGGGEFVPSPQVGSKFQSVVLALSDSYTNGILTDHRGDCNINSFDHDVDVIALAYARLGFSIGYLIRDFYGEVPINSYRLAPLDEEGEKLINQALDDPRSIITEYLAAQEGSSDDDSTKADLPSELIKFFEKAGVNPETMKTTDGTAVKFARLTPEQVSKLGLPDDGTQDDESYGQYL